MMNGRYWAVTVETPDGQRNVYAVSYPRKPTADLAAGLVRPQLGMPQGLPDEYRWQEDASLRALEAAGYRLLEIAPPQGRE
ncbi:hypothetical protein Y5W_00335 [Alcanivorax sp. 521-1]|uniref:YcgL domain-containing protein n=1 Tax=Alloalcanivorax profundimaris TaxID=2735259 RepID=A0ABS0ANH4_9GAMM|nr:hypothetical protein [Alloalcanivorax profundimaris]MBF5055041.1 hypothetical protein [Alloalcanivorax profundimaris]